MPPRAQPACRDTGISCPVEGRGGGHGPRLTLSYQPGKCALGAEIIVKIEWLMLEGTLESSYSKLSSRKLQERGREGWDTAAGEGRLQDGALWVINSPGRAGAGVTRGEERKSSAEAGMKWTPQ